MMIIIIIGGVFYEKICDGDSAAVSGRALRL